MFEATWNLPAGVNVETDRDARTVDVYNSTDAPVVVQLAPVMRAFGRVVGDEEGIVRLWPGERFAFYKIGTTDCVVTCRR